MNSDSTRDFIFFAMKKQAAATLPEIVIMAARFPYVFTYDGSGYLQFHTASIINEYLLITGFLAEAQDKLGWLNSRKNCQVTVGMSPSPFCLRVQADGSLTCTNSQVPSPVTSVSWTKGTGSAFEYLI